MISWSTEYISYSGLMLNNVRCQTGNGECTKEKSEGWENVREENKQPRRLFDAQQMTSPLKGFHAPPRTVASQLEREEKREKQGESGGIYSPMLRLGLMFFTVRGGVQSHSHIWTYDLIQPKREVTPLLVRSTPGHSMQ